MPEFWMVYNTEGRTPAFRHSSERSARDEAERLARGNPRQRFWVLAAIDGVTCPRPPVEWVNVRRPEPDDACNQCDAVAVSSKDMPF